MSGDAVMLYVYGTYLLNGGTKDRFLDFDSDDLQIMATVATARMKRQADMNAASVSKLFRSERDD